MFIDVTLYGGLKLLRLQVAAIAYLGSCPNGTAIHLIGGETLRVNEDPAEIEKRVEAHFALFVASPEELVDVEISSFTPPVLAPGPVLRGKPAAAPQRAPKPKKAQAA